MNQILKLIFTVIMIFFASSFFSSSMQASPLPKSQDQAKLTVNVNIDQPDIFWNYTFLTKDGELGKPAVIKLTWSRGDSPSREKSEVIMSSTKSSGKTVILTEKGALVNLRVCIYDTKNTKLGYIDLQVSNNGQSESVNISPPEKTEPTMTWANY